MHIETTFWNEKVEKFTELHMYHNSTKEIKFSANLNNPFDTYAFFKNCSLFIKTQKYEEKGSWQFAVINCGKICGIIWFDIVVNENTTISHDFAFETTLIRKNKIPQPFGRFPLNTKRFYPINRKFKLQSRIFKYIANEVMKSQKSYKTEL